MRGGLRSLVWERGRVSRLRRGRQRGSHKTQREGEGGRAKTWDMGSETHKTQREGGRESGGFDSAPFDPMYGFRNLESIHCVFGKGRGLGFG